MDVLWQALAVFVFSTVGVNGQPSPDACDKPLGMENGLIGNHQIQASSSHESSSVGPNHGRLNSEVGGGAWCPKYLVHNRSEQFLEIDLEKPHRITGILTQGRYGNGLGMEFAEYYSVSFWNPSMTAFQRYADDENGTWLFMANSNTYSIATNRLAMPIVAQKLRILPFSGHPRTICMRLELLGCSVNDQGVTIDNRNARNNKTRTRSDEDLIHSSLSTEMTDGDISTNGQVTFVDQTDNLATMPWDISGLVGVVLGVAISVAVVLVGLLVIAYRRRSFPPKSGTNYASIESLTFSGGSQPSISPKEREVGSSPPFFIIQDGPIYSEPIHGNTLERTKREYFGLDSTLKPSLSSFSAHYQNLQEGTPPLEPCDRFFPDYAQDHVPENLFPQFWANTNEVPCYACTELPANLKSKAETKSLAGESGLPIYSIPETFVTSSLSTSSTTSSPFSTGRKCF